MGGGTGSMCPPLKYAPVCVRVPTAHDHPFDFYFYYDNGNCVNKKNNRCGDGSVGETFIR